MNEIKKNQAELAILNVDEELHKTVVGHFIRLIMLDVVSFTVIAAILGFFIYNSGINLWLGGLLVLCVGVVAWNVGSLVSIIMRKYICCLVTVDKVWEEKGVLMCRVTPDAYDNYDFTGAITVKNHTKDLQNVKEGMQVIVAAGKFSRYIYLFDYTGDRYVTERRSIAVEKNTSFVPSEAYTEKYGLNMFRLEHLYFGELAFEMMENKEYGTWYFLNEGLTNMRFGSLNVWDFSEFVVEEERLEDILGLLEKTYKNSDRVLADIYSIILKDANNQTPRDQSGNEIDIRYIEANFVVEDIVVRVAEGYDERGDEIALFIGPYDSDGEELYDGQQFRIGVNCETGEMSCELDYF